MMLSHVEIVSIQKLIGANFGALTFQFLVIATWRRRVPHLCGEGLLISVVKASSSMW